MCSWLSLIVYGNSDGKETEVTAARQTWANPSVMMKMDKWEQWQETSRVDADVSLPKGGYCVFLPHKKSYHFLGEEK